MIAKLINRIFPSKSKKILNKLNHCIAKLEKPGFTKDPFYKTRTHILQDILCKQLKLSCKLVSQLERTATAKTVVTDKELSEQDYEKRKQDTQLARQNRIEQEKQDTRTIAEIEASLDLYTYLVKYATRLPKTEVDTNDHRDDVWASCQHDTSNIKDHTIRRK